MARHKFTSKTKLTPPTGLNPEWNEWGLKGATLSHKTAFKEFGLTEKEIVQAIRAGKLQFRENSVFGNPFFRLLRREVESLVKQTKGANDLQDLKIKSELKRINGQLKQLKTQIAALERDRSQLLGENVHNGANAQKKFAQRSK